MTGMNSVDRPAKTTHKPPRPRRKWTAVLLLLLVVPGNLWPWDSAVPFAPPPAGTKVKVRLVPALVVLAEAIFRVAAIFSGAEAVSRYRRYLDPRRWFRKGRR
ncbi:MAG: hypothetical protein WA990_16810 [Rubrobacteraceae bacterium]